MMVLFKRYGWVIVGAIFALLTGVACFLGYETYSLGTISLNQMSPEAAAVTLPGPECRVAVLRSEYTSKFLKTATNYNAHIEYWQKLAQKINAPSELIADTRLEEGLQGFKILLLPSAICLSQKERASIRDFVSKGGGVICTWATGARDENGTWKGLDFLKGLTGAETLEFVERTPPWFVSLASDNPITAGSPSGFRIQVDSPERLQAKSFRVDGYWSDVRLFPVVPNLPANFQGAVLHNTMGRGRVVWFGFQENSGVAGGSNQVILDLTLTNALVWTGQKALGAVNPWPAPYTAASLFACDVEDEYSNAGYAANALRKTQEKGTFFCLTDLVKEDADLIPQLKGAGEVASHGDTHARFGNAGRLSQVIRLASSKWRLRRLGGSWAAGFHPPSDDFGDRTLEALAATRFRYVLIGGENSAGANSVMPDIVRVSQTSPWFHRDTDLVRLTRTMEDDLHYSPLGIVGLDPSWITQRALADFEIIHGLGGLFIFAFHSQGFSAPEYVGIIPSLIDQYHRSGTWIATAEDVAHWWQLRSHLSVSVSDKGASGIRLTVKYGGAQSLDKVALAFYPPGESVEGHVVPVGAPQAPAQIVPDPNNGRLSLQLGRLEPGRVYQYDLFWGQ